jgi:hypothetical protein
VKLDPGTHVFMHSGLPLTPGVTMGLLMLLELMLLKQGLPFQGHDESKKSLNQGNFREFRTFTAEQNPTLKRQ